MTKLTIIIPCLNEIKLLKRCLNAIADRLPQQRVVVIQMGKWQLSLNDYPTLQLHIIRSTPLPAAAARNLGARAIASDYIWFLDSDNWLIGTAPTWQNQLYSALAQSHELIILQRAEEQRNIPPAMPTRWNFSRHCIEWNLIWSRQHFLALGGFNPLTGTGSPTLAQGGEAFGICFQHFEPAHYRTLYLPELAVAHPSLTKPQATPAQQFAYMYGSNYVTFSQLRRKPSLLSAYWFMRTLMGFAKLQGSQARALALWDALTRHSPR